MTGSRVSVGVSRAHMPHSGGGVKMGHLPPPLSRPFFLSPLLCRRSRWSLLLGRLVKMVSRTNSLNQCLRRAAVSCGSKVTTVKGRTLSWLYVTQIPCLIQKELGWILQCAFHRPRGNTEDGGHQGGPAGLTGPSRTATLNSGEQLKEGPVAQRKMVLSQAPQRGRGSYQGGSCSTRPLVKSWELIYVRASQVPLTPCNRVPRSMHRKSTS